MHDWKNNFRAEILKSAHCVQSRWSTRKGAKCHYHSRRIIILEFLLESNYPVVFLASLNRDGDISWTMTSHGHFFSKWVTSRGHFLRATSLGHFGWLFVDIFGVNSRGHFGWHEKSPKIHLFGKVIHTKYSKHRPSTVAHTFECVCSKINHGLNHGLFILLLKLINCPIHWIVYK